MPQVLGRVVDAPVLSGGSFEPVAQVGPAEEPLGPRWAGVARPAIRFISTKPAGTDGASDQADRHRSAAGDIEIEANIVWLCQVRA